MDSPRSRPRERRRYVPKPQVRSSCCTVPRNGRFFAPNAPGFQIHSTTRIAQTDMLPEDNKTPFDGFFALLPDAHFDLLARIVPGIIAVAIYFSSFVASISTVIGIASLVLSAYVVGFLADALSEFIVRDGWDCLIRIIKRASIDTRYGDYDLWGRIRRLDADNRAVLTKMMAEKAGFRVFAFLLLLVFLFPPVLPACNGPDEPFQDAIEWLLTHRTFLLLLSGSCFLCHFAVGRWIRYFLASLPSQKIIT